MTEARVVADTDSARANAEAVLAFFAAALRPPYDLDAVERLVAEDYLDHDPYGEDTRRDGVRAKLEGMWGGLPGGAFVPTLAVAAGDLVTVRSDLVPAGGSPTVAFHDTYRVADGRIAEHWHVLDTAALAALFGG
ncbi:MAG: nuclear transport factor 2 family protein [Actinomycetales bacterium]|nr:nuclear transport factor 2 family protein [Actinomycetales bacterium]